MPYSIKKRNGYDIINKDTGKKVGHSDSRAKAESSVRSRLAGEHGWVQPKKRSK